MKEKWPGTRPVPLPNVLRQGSPCSLFLLGIWCDASDSFSSVFTGFWRALYWLWASLVLVPIRNVMLWHLVQFDRQRDRTGACVCAVFSSMALAHPLPNTHWSPSGSLYTSLIAAHQLLIGWPLASWRFPRASKVFRMAFTGWNGKAEMIWKRWSKSVLSVRKVS